MSRLANVLAFGCGRRRMGAALACGKGYIASTAMCVGCSIANGALATAQPTRAVDHLFFTKWPAAFRIGRGSQPQIVRYAKHLFLRISQAPAQLMAGLLHPTIKCPAAMLTDSKY